MGSDWLGTLPAWFSAGVALFALGAASASAFFNYRGNQNQQTQIEHQQHQLDRLEEDKRREQASKVAAWIHLEPPSVYESPGIGPVARRERTYIRIANTSNLPIYFVVAWVEDWTLDGQPQIGQAVVQRIIPPGGKDIPFDLAGHDIDEAFVSIVFHDADDNSWFRDRLGNLNEEADDGVSTTLENVRIPMRGRAMNGEGVGPL